MSRDAFLQKPPSRACGEDRGRTGHMRSRRFFLGKINIIAEGHPRASLSSKLYYKNLNYNHPINLFQRDGKMSFGLSSGRFHIIKPGLAFAQEWQLECGFPRSCASETLHSKTWRHIYRPFFPRLDSQWLPDPWRYFSGYFIAWIQVIKQQFLRLAICFRHSFGRYPR